MWKPKSCIVPQVTRDTFQHLYQKQLMLCGFGYHITPVLVQPPQVLGLGERAKRFNGAGSVVLTLTFVYRETLLWVYRLSSGIFLFSFLRCSFLRVELQVMFCGLNLKKTFFYSAINCHHEAENYSVGPRRVAVLHSHWGSLAGHLVNACTLTGPRGRWCRWLVPNPHLAKDEGIAVHFLPYRSHTATVFLP